MNYHPGFACSLLHIYQEAPFAAAKSLACIKRFRLLKCIGDLQVFKFESMNTCSFFLKIQR